MLVPRSLSRAKIAVLLALLALTVAVGAYFLVADLGGSLPDLSAVSSTRATFGGSLDDRLVLPDPATIAEPSAFDDVVTRELQDDGTLPVRGGQLYNADPFAPLPVSQLKKR